MYASTLGGVIYFVSLYLISLTPFAKLYISYTDIKQKLFYIYILKLVIYNIDINNNPQWSR